MPARTTVSYIMALSIILLMGCVSRKPPEVTEQLLAKPPAGWVNVYQYNQAGNRISEFIPVDEDNLKWINKITFESFPHRNTADPIDLLMFEVDQYQKKCNFVQHFNLFAGLENNYPTSLRLIMCGQSKVLDTGEVTMVKAISGDANFYIVRITRKVPAFEPNQPDVSKEDIASWSIFLSRILVCEKNSSEHPCTAPQPEQ